MDLATQVSLHRSVGRIFGTTLFLIGALNALAQILLNHRATGRLIFQSGTTLPVVFAVVAVALSLFDAEGFRVAQTSLIFASGCAFIVSGSTFSLTGILFCVYSLILALEYGLMRSAFRLKLSITLGIILAALVTESIRSANTVARIYTAEIMIVAFAISMLICTAYRSRIRAYRTESSRMQLEIASNRTFVNVGRDVIGLIHNIKSKLMSLEGFGDLMVRGVKNESADVPHWASMQRASIEQMRSMIDTLLSSVRAQHQPEPKAITLSGIIHGSLEILQANDDVRREIDLTVELCDDDVVFVPPSSAVQVLDSLIRNAWEATEHRAGRTVVIRTVHDSDFVRCSIGDNGTGLPFCSPCEHANCLDCPNFRIGRSTKPDGSGIGVVHARNLLRTFDGKLRYNSAPNVGTTVEVWFPRRREPG